MKARFILPALMLLTVPAAMSVAHAEELTTWPKESINGKSYYGLHLLRTFYKLSPTETKKSVKRHITRNSAFSLGLTPGSREATISGYRVHLSSVVQQNSSGELLVSEVDLVKLLDPILRPTYIPERRNIQTVVIDPGHGGTDNGNKTQQIKESDYTLKLAQELAEALKKQGLNVVLTRTTNRNVSDVERVNTAKSAHAAIFVSLHLNGGRSDMTGIETYTAAPAAPNTRAMEGNRHDAANAALAFALHSHAVAATKAPDRACRRARYTLLNTLSCPAVMMMVGYASHEQEANSLASDTYRAELVKGLCNGILTFKKAIRPGAEITIPAPPKKVEPAPAPKQVAKKETTDKKEATSTKKKAKRSSRNSSRRSSSSRSRNRR